MIIQRHGILLLKFMYLLVQALKGGDEIKSFLDKKSDKIKNLR
jgi:hypothetical protein